MRLSLAAGRRLAATTVVALAALAATATAQQAAPAAPAPTGPKVGEMAPDFSLPGATRYGLLREPITLSELRGQTVVLAFFIKARTRG